MIFAVFLRRPQPDSGLSGQSCRFMVRGGPRRSVRKLNPPANLRAVFLPFDGLFRHIRGEHMAAPPHRLDEFRGSRVFFFQFAPQASNLNVDAAVKGIPGAVMGLFGRLVPAYQAVGIPEVNGKKDEFPLDHDYCTDMKINYCLLVLE